MKRPETTTAVKESNQAVHAVARFAPVLDSRNRKVPGLYTRNGRYYLQLWADRGDGTKTARKFPLLREDGGAVEGLTEAREAADRLRHDRRQDSLPASGRKPSFKDFSAAYLSSHTTATKKPGTVENETQAVSRWADHLGSVPVDKISTRAIAAYIEKRLQGATLGRRVFKPASPRTVRLDLIMLRNVLKAARNSGHLRTLPEFPEIKVPPSPRRALITQEELARLLGACMARDEDGRPVTKNGEQLRDFLRFLAFSGAREQEALGVKWCHLDKAGGRIWLGASEDFTAGRLHVGVGGSTKNLGSRAVDLNPQLSALLDEMASRRAPDCTWLFPSPQRGARDVPARSLKESMRLVRDAAELPSVGFHDLRHVFASYCVMAGIDFMTIAAWLGHKDGGILVGKVYGHLLDAHRQQMAARLKIG